MNSTPSTTEESRGSLMDWFRSIGFSQPEAICNGLDTAAVLGVKRWYLHETSRGTVIGTGLIRNKLLEGGMASYGVGTSGPRNDWERRRIRWAPEIEALSDLRADTVVNLGMLMEWHTGKRPSAAEIRAEHDRRMTA